MTSLVINGYSWACSSSSSEMTRSSKFFASFSYASCTMEFWKRWPRTADVFNILVIIVIIICSIKSFRPKFLIFPRLLYSSQQMKVCCLVTGPSNVKCSLWCASPAFQVQWLHFRSSDCISGPVIAFQFQSLTTYHSHFDFCFGCLAINPSPSRTFFVFKSSCTTGSSCTGCKYSIPWTTPWVRHNFFDVNRFILLDEIFKIFVRNVFQDNAIVLRLENHRIQLDNVGMIQFVWLCLAYQLILRWIQLSVPCMQLFPSLNVSHSIRCRIRLQQFFPPSSAHCTVSWVRVRLSYSLTLGSGIVFPSHFISLLIPFSICCCPVLFSASRNLSNWKLVKLNVGLTTEHRQQLLVLLERCHLRTTTTTTSV